AELQLRLPDLERHSGQAGAAAHIDDAAGRLLPHTDPATQRVEKVTCEHRLTFLDGGEVEALVPLQQFIGVALKGCGLCLTQRHAQQCMHRVGKAAHACDYMWNEGIRYCGNEEGN